MSKQLIITGDNLIDYLNSSITFLEVYDLDDEDLRPFIIELKEMRTYVNEIVYNNSLANVVAKSLTNYLANSNNGDEITVDNFISFRIEVEAISNIVNQLYNWETNNDAIKSLIGLYHRTKEYTKTANGSVSIADIGYLVKYGVFNVVYKHVLAAMEYNEAHVDEDGGLDGFKSSYLNSSLISARRIVNITHTDNDGYFCAGLLSMAAKKKSGVPIKVYTTGYKVNMDEIKELVNDADEVWITDLNLDINTLVDIVNLKDDIHWYYVDHHNRNFKDSRDEVGFINELNKTFDGFIYEPTLPYNEVNRSACLILHGILNDFVDIDIQSDVIEYISAWDVRCFATLSKDDVFQFTYGINTVKFDPTTEDGLNKIVSIIECTDDIINEYKWIGESILIYKDKSNELGLKVCGFEFGIVDDNGREYSCIGYNYFGDSYCFSDKTMNKYDICATFCITSVGKYGEMNRKFTLYSNKEDINCGEICKQINNGGGHYGAAGFLTSDNLFTNDIGTIKGESLLPANKPYLTTLKQRESLGMKAL